jgi:hypothetical protein
MQWNTGRSYKLDRARHNKQENYEVPINKRKRRFKKGGAIDDKKAMVLSQIKEVHHHADELAKVLANMDTVDAWVVGKMERATTDLSDITHYLDGTTEYAKGGKIAVRNESLDEKSEIDGRRRYAVEIQDEGSGDVLDYDYFDSEKEAEDFISKYADGGIMDSDSDKLYYTVQIQTMVIRRLSMPKSSVLNEEVKRFSDIDIAIMAYEQALNNTKALIKVMLKVKNDEGDYIILARSDEDKYQEKDIYYTVACQSMEGGEFKEVVYDYYHIDDANRFYQKCLTKKDLIKVVLKVKDEESSLILKRSDEDKFAYGGMMAKGGMSKKKTKGIDLFEDYQDIPTKVQKVLDKYQEDIEDGDYKGLEKALKELEKIGYTFEYGLDGIAYDLRPIGTQGKSEFMEF